VSFECRVDGAAFGACSGPGEGFHTTPTLADGAHTFEVRARDTFGTADPTPASSNFTVDTTAPPISIDSGPAGATNIQRPTFAFSSTDGTATFACSIDQGTESFGACSGAGSHQPASDLADGSYTFRVRATDPAGNSTTATRSFTVDTRVPNTKITGGPKAVTTKRSARFKFKSSEPGSSFKCKLDRRRFKPCKSPKTYRHLKRGKHAFKVRAIDRAGNVDPHAGEAKLADQVDHTEPGPATFFTTAARSRGTLVWICIAIGASIGRNRNQEARCSTSSPHTSTPSSCAAPAGSSPRSRVSVPRAPSSTSA